METNKLIGEHLRATVDIQPTPPFPTNSHEQCETSGVLGFGLCFGFRVTGVCCGSIQQEVLCAVWAQRGSPMEARFRV